VNQEAARTQLIDIVRDAGDVGFETLVRALTRTEQEGLAKQLDEVLAEKFIKKSSAMLSMSLPFIFSLVVVFAS